MSRADLTVAALVVLSVGAVVACGSRSDLLLEGHASTSSTSSSSGSSTGSSGSSSSSTSSGSTSSSSGTSSTSSSSSGGPPGCAVPGTTLTIATYPSTYLPQSVVLDANNVYWGGSGVYSAPLCGGAVTALSTSQLAGPASLAVDATNVYWLAHAGTSSTLYAADKTSGAVRHLLDLPDIMPGPNNGVPCCTLTAVAGEAVVVVGNATPSTNWDNSLIAIPPQGGAPTTLASHLGYTENAASVGNQAVFFSSLASNSPVQLLGVQLSGTVSTLAVVQGVGVGIASGGSRVAWLDPMTPTLWSLEVPGGTPVSVPAPEAYVFLATDGTNLYYTMTSQSDGLAMVPAAGGVTTTLVAPGSGTALGPLAADATSVYVTTKSDIRRIVLR